MTIVFFTRLFYPHIGGVEKHVYEVSKRLREYGYKVIIVTELFQNDLAKHQKYEGLEIYRIPTVQNRFKKFFIWYWLWRHMNIIRRAEIVHCHDVFFWYLPFRMFFPTKKVSTTFHGYEGNSLPSRRAIFMHRLAHLFSHKTICIGEFLQKWYGTKATTILYGGVTLSNHEPKTILPKHNPIRAVFVGRLEEETGIMTYLKALAILKRRGIPIVCAVLGDGLQREEAELFAKTNSLSVTYKGFVQHVEKYLPDADIVFTSRYLGILEAFAQKKFVFASYNNVIKEDYLRRTPFHNFLSCVKDEFSLAEEISFHLHNPKVMHEKIQKGYAWVRGMTWESVVDAYIRVWN